MGKFKGILLLLILGAILVGCNPKNSTEEVIGDEQVNSVVDQEVETEELEDPEVKTSQYYFTANEAGSISKINVSTNLIEYEFEFDGTVHNVQVSPNGSIIGATLIPGDGEHDGGGHAEGINGKAIFYDIESNELIKEVEVGSHPAHIEFTDNGKYAVVTNNEDHNISVIDMEKIEVVNTVETGKGPHGFRISKDSKKIYIANMGEDTVSVISLETMTEEKKIEVGQTPVTTGITSDGKTLVVSLNSENKLAIVDLTTNIIEKVQVGEGPAQVYIDVTDQYAYVANQGSKDSPSNTLSVIELATKKVVSTIETGKGAHGVVSSSDNKRVYVTNMFEDTVSIIDVETNKVIETIDVKGVPNGISIMK